MDSNFKVTVSIIVAGVKPGNAGRVVVAPGKPCICFDMHVLQAQVSPVQYSQLKHNFSCGWLRLM